MERELTKIYNRTEFRDYVKESKKLFETLTQKIGAKVVDVLNASEIYKTLTIEMDNNYYWSKAWTKEEQKKVVEQLSKAHQLREQYSWDSPLIQRLRSGGLVKELNKNLNFSINSNKTIINKKLFVYSTQEKDITGLMHALNIYNISAPNGTALLLELHKKAKNSAKDKYNDKSNDKSEYFLRVFYQNSNDSYSGVPQSVEWRNCQNLIDCPVDQYLKSTEQLLYENFGKECNQTEGKN